MEENLAAVDGRERARMARDTYSYLHFPIVVGIIFVAFGLKETVAHPLTPLAVIHALALCGGGALYLLGDAACRLRDVGRVSIPRLAVVIGCLCVYSRSAVGAFYGRFSRARGVVRRTRGFRDDIFRVPSLNS